MTTSFWFWSDGIVLSPRPWSISHQRHQADSSILFTDDTTRIFIPDDTNITLYYQITAKAVFHLARIYLSQACIGQMRLCYTDKKFLSLAVVLLSTCGAIWTLKPDTRTRIWPSIGLGAGIVRRVSSLLLTWDLLPIYVPWLPCTKDVEELLVGRIRTGKTTCRCMWCVMVCWGAYWKCWMAVWTWSGSLVLVGMWRGLRSDKPRGTDKSSDKFTASWWYCKPRSAWFLLTKL